MGFKLTVKDQGHSDIWAFGVVEVAEAPLGSIAREMNMTTQNADTLTKRSYDLAQDLAALDDFLHAVVGGPLSLYLQEAEAAKRVHRKICKSAVLASRIHLWSAFRPQFLMAWDGKTFNVVDTSAYTVDWAAKCLGSIEHFFHVHRRDLKTLRKAARRVAAASSSDQMGRRTA